MKGNSVAFRSNGAGKATLLRTLSGFYARCPGLSLFDRTLGAYSEPGAFGKISVVLSDRLGHFP